MSGGKQKQPLALGYTIIEVMIVLAVSGVMFIIAATLISGKQEQAQFRNDVKTMTSNLQVILNNVADGLNPETNVANLKCVTVSTDQIDGVEGSNPKCIYLGEALYFKTANTFATVPLSGTTTFDVAKGLESDADTGIAAVNPAAATLSQQTQTIGSLSIDPTQKGAMCVTDINGNKTASYGFVATMSLNGDTYDPGAPNGATSVNLYGFSQSVSPLGNNPIPASVGQKIPTLTDPAHVAPALQEVDMYVNDGKQYAKISIKDNNGLSIDYAYTNGPPPVVPCT